MPTKAVMEFVDQQDWLDAVSSGIYAGADAAYSALGSARGQAEDLLHGTWTGHPLHPVLTDFTVGMWLATMLFDGLETLSGSASLGLCSEAAIGAGLASSVVTASAGITDWMRMGGRTRRVGALHAVLNGGSLVFYGTSLALRRRGRRGAGRVSALLGLSVAGVAAYLGSELVYGLGAGVSRKRDRRLPDEGSVGIEEMTAVGGRQPTDERVPLPTESVSR
ncbi:MAG: DUF2231 domain-containing protein [Anaerolineae bacterium]